MIIEKICAFIKRDLRINSSYRFSFIFQLGGIFSSLFTFFFISKLMGNSPILSVYGYGEDYFSYVIAGIAFSSYQGAAMDAGDILDDEHESGALEAILLTPTSIGTIIMVGLIYELTWTTIIIFSYLFFGIFFFHMKVGDANLVTILITTILSITSYVGIGLISTASVLIFKSGDPLSWCFSGLSKFLGGVFFPIALLPDWTQKFSYFLPITHSLEAIRGALLKGQGISVLSDELLFLFFFSIIFLPIGAFFLKFAIYRCKKNGSLTHS